MKCLSCGETTFDIVKYDNHIFKFHYKYFLRFFFKKIDFLIPNFTFLKKLKKNSSNVFKGNIYICKKCRLGEAVEKPSVSELSKYYQNFYWQSFRNNKNENLLNKSFNKSSRAIQQANYILKYSLKEINDILEVGGGNCDTSLLLRDKNNKIKISCCDSKFWKDYYKTNIINHIEELFPFSSESKYDLIISSHHLEHMLDLKNSINALYNLLKDDGYLFVEVPNTPDVYWKRYIIDTPHLFFFTQKSLINVFKKSGFRLVGSQIFGNTYDDLIKKVGQNYQNINKDGAYLKAVFKK